MEKKYIINQSQFDDIVQYKFMMRELGDTLKHLCNRDDPSDITIGFELGRVNYDLSKCFMDMLQLELDIKNQVIDDDVPF